MLKALRFLLLLCTLVAGGAAFASFPATPGLDTSTCNPSNYPRSYLQDPSVSASWLCGPSWTTPASCGWAYSSGSYGWDGTPTNGVWAGQCTAAVADQCPANSTKAGSSCTCNSGFNEQGGQCVNPDQACQAKSGTTAIVNVTSGWQRTPSAASGEDWLYPTKLSSSGTGSVCNGGCMQNFDAAESCSTCGAYVSQVPNAQGLHRVSTDFVGHYSGGTCSGTDPLITPSDSTDPPCPGFVGEVNGVKGCYGTADKPIRPSPPDPYIDRQPKDKGNPPAGEKPASGEGSGSGGAGRTPSAGSGGSGGGPAGAAGSGKKPDGTTDKPTDEKKEQQNCGAPGQPKCGIDETGTPKGTSTFDAARDSLKTAADKRDGGLDSIKSTSDKDTSWGTVPAWIDHAACTPWDLGVLELPGRSIPLLVDICVIEPYVVGVMSFLWVVGTFFAVIGMVFRVTTATAG